MPQGSCCPLPPSFLDDPGVDAKQGRSIGAALQHGYQGVVGYCEPSWVSSAA